MIGTGQGLRMFSKRHYEVTLMENTPSPALVFDFDALDEVGNKMVEYSIVRNDYRGKEFITYLFKQS